MNCDHPDHLGQNRYRGCIDAVPVFARLSDRDKEAITRVAIGKQFAKGALLYVPGEPLEGLFILHRGRVKVSRLSPGGKEQILRILAPGEFTGEYALFGRQPTADAAQALVDTEVCIIRSEDIKRLLLDAPAMALGILEQYATRLSQADMHVEQLALYDVGQRVARVMLELTTENKDECAHGVDENDPIEITLPYSKGDMAALIGTSPESLSRKLTEFQQQGWIQPLGQRRIRILQPTELRHLMQS